MDWMNYLKVFVIGSSFFTFTPFVLAVNQMEHRNFSLEYYPIKASAYFGIMNVISLFLAEQFTWNTLTRFGVISILSAMLISMLITIQRAWTFPTTQRWFLQYLLLLISHSFTFLVTIRLLESLIQ